MLGLHCCAATELCCVSSPVDTALRASLARRCDTACSCRSGCSSPNRAIPSTRRERTNRCTRSGTFQRRLEKKHRCINRSLTKPECVFVYLPTCPVSSVVEVNAEGPWLVLPLPRRRGTVLVVGVGVVVVNIPEGDRTRVTTRGSDFPKSHVKLF